MQVIGAGLGRTGTTSLKAALELLGFGPCHHMTEILEHPEQAPAWKAALLGEPVNWDDVLAGYRSATDFPAAKFWQPLSEAYPDARLILTVRDPERWYVSLRETLGPIRRLAFGPDGKPNLPPRAKRLQPVLEMLNVMAINTFGDAFDDKDAMIALFRRHNADVVEALPAERLLVYEVKQGWQPLCEFLQVPVPDVPFPHVNDRAEFQTRVTEALGLAG